MKGIVSTNRIELEQINTRIHNWMKLNIPNYNAVRWSKIIKHPTEEKYFLPLNDDSRNPKTQLSASENSRLITIAEKEWFPHLVERGELPR